jgi:hypothetical protein
MNTGHHGTIMCTAALGLLLGGCDVPADARDTQTLSAAESADDDCLAPPDDVPPAIAAPADECLAVRALGAGVQIYTCTAGAWVLKAPEANLLDRHDRFVGNHFLGPTWQWHDGSKIKGARVAQVAAADPAHDVAWLLLSVTSSDGAGRLAGIKHVQRVHTAGGVAPAGACTEGAEVRVPYSADYLFYRLSR